MKARDTDRLIANELRQMRRGPADSPQNYYRMAYVAARRSSLGPNGLVTNSPEAAREIALRVARREDPTSDLPA